MIWLDQVLPWSPEAFACPLYFGSFGRTGARAVESSVVAAGKQAKVEGTSALG